MLSEFFKSVLDTDRAPVVLCDLMHTVVYMNKAAANRYEKAGGMGLVGKSLLDCHSKRSVEIINRVVAWFKESRKNNMIYTFRNEKENKDVYMVALRNDCGELIGYYEKHEHRIPESAELYDFEGSLI